MIRVSEMIRKQISICNDNEYAGESCHPLILIAEDDMLTLRLTCDILNGQGYRTIEITNGKMVYECVKQRKPDAMILDISLEGMDGIEVSRKLRNDPEFSQMPIIVITGYSESEMQEIAVEIGFDLFFTKPVSVKKLVAAVESVLAKNKKYVVEV